MSVLDDPNRVFITSDFVRLEVLPKAEYYNNTDEVKFYNTFFESAEQIIRASRTLVSEAHSEASNAGLAAMDALHVAAAKKANATELITAEKSSRTIFRATSVAVKTIRPNTEP